MSPKAIRRKREWVYIKTHPILFTIAIIAIVNGFIFTFADVDDTAAIAQTLNQPLQLIWLLAYAAAGAMIVWGFIKFEVRYEAAGLVLLASCCITDFYAIIAYRGWGAMVGSSMILALGVGAGFRAWAILTTRL